MMSIASTLKKAVRANRFIQQRVRTTEVNRLLAFPERVEIESTSFCNGRCRHCEHPSLGRPYAHMDMGLYRRVIDECDQWRKYCKEVFLFWMGEPFMDPEFFDKVRYAKAKNSFVVSSYSNGSMLTPDVCRALVDSGLDKIVFGTDGATRESYESIRVGLSFGRMVEGITRLASLKKQLGVRKPYVHVQMVLTPENAHEEALFRQSWAGVADEVTTRKMVVWGGDTIDDGLMDYSRELVGRGYPPSTPCAFLWRLMVVAQDGRVALCCTDSRVQHEVGDLTTESVRQVWQGQRMRDLREVHVAGRLNDIPICETCNHRQIIPYPWWWYR